jgi:hypothetical protein
MNMITEIFNFDNIGGKIKGFAQMSCWITIILIWIVSPIAFLVLLFSDYLAFLCWIPLLVAIVVPPLVWICSWTMYAFGELVEGVREMDFADEIKNIDENVQAMATPAIQETEINTKCKANTKAKREAEERAARMTGNAIRSWTCTCGRINDYYVTTCTCGMNRRNVKEKEAEIKQDNDPTV